MEEIERVLEQVAEAHAEPLRLRLRDRLEERERGVLDWLWDRYQDRSKRRWYDPYHVLYSADHALRLVVAEGVDRLVVPGTLLHDVGYFAVEDMTQWSRPESRITHMQEGAALTAGLACRLGYDPDEVEALVSMVAVHDNPYIGLPIRGRDRLALRDSDRAFVMHLLSFYKEWSQWRERYPEPEGLLRDRIAQFFGMDAPFAPGPWAIAEADLARNAGGLELPAYALTRTLVARQCACRIRELEGEPLWRDPVRLKSYAMEQIEREFFLDESEPFGLRT